jgi:hypothetical protein
VAEIKDGYTRIANDLLETVMLAGLSLLIKFPVEVGCTTQARGYEYE